MIFVQRQVFDLTDSVGRFVRLSITSNYGGDLVQANELAFSTSPVPEPSTALLLALGLIGLAARQKQIQ